MMAKAARKSAKPAVGKGGRKDVEGDEIRGAVREHYGALARTSQSCCSTSVSSCGCSALYPQAEILSLPQDAIAVSAGCGNPTAIASLKPGGKLAVSDIVLLSDLPDEIRKDLTAWSSCVSGAVSEKEYIGAMRKAGFEQVKVEDRVVYTHEQLEDYLKDSEHVDRTELRGRNLSELIASYRITAVKPKV